MSANSPAGAGRFTTYQTTIPAGEVHVPGAPLGAAGSRRLGQNWLSSQPARYTPAPDIAELAPAPHRFVPARPATQSEYEGADC